MPNQFFLKKRPHNGLTYDEYMEVFAAKVNSTKADITKDTIDEYEKLKLNLHRSLRIQKSYSVNTELIEIIKEIDKPQIWMVITEDWCGDSAQTIPYINKIASHNSLIEVRILLRDENTDIIDHYLTNETRSIPKLVAFDTDGNELFTWGPRPKEAVELIKKSKSEGKTKDQFIAELHLWYAKDKGQSLEKEFINLLQSIANYSNN